MAAVISPLTIRVEFRYTWQGEQCENVVHVKTTATPTATDVQNAAERGLTWWAANAAPQTSTTLQLREVYARSIASSIAPEFTAVPDTTLTGALTTESMPNNVTFCLSLRTGQAGRSARGRWYWAGLTTQQVSGTLIEAAAIVALVDAIFALISAFELDNLDFVVMSRFSGGIERAVPVLIPVTTVLAVDNVVDSQRRRLPGRGR